MNKEKAALMEAKSKVDAALTNYSISFIFDAQGQDEYFFRQATSDKGTFFELKGEGSDHIDYVDFVNNIGYELDAVRKCGETFPLEPAEAYRGLAFHTAGHLLFTHAGRDDLVKIGSEKVIGRDTTVCSITFDNGEMKLWIDDEYGLALKYEQTGDAAMRMYVTEFTVGGVTVEGMIDISEYEIE